MELMMFEEVKAIKKQTKTDKYQKQKWRNQLQKYCDIQSEEVGSTNGYCVCGYMSYCDYCRGAGKTNACVKAICQLCNEKRIEIDYNNFDFESFLERVEE